jgi:MOSC domain-containing protein YiiM
MAISIAEPFRLLTLRVGRIQQFGPAGQPSAIAKLPVDRALSVDASGLAGDQHADSVHHGGIDKALHHYPAEHYAVWAAELPYRTALFVIGGFGENLSTLGLTEDNVCLGDIFQVGSAMLQVSQGRNPCWKLDHRFGVPDMVRRVQDSGRTGWYYRVLAAGSMTPEDALTLVERPLPEWPLVRLFRVLHAAQPDRLALEELAESSVLAASWRKKAGKRLSDLKL